MHAVPNCRAQRIDNIPTPEAFANLEALVLNILDPLRDRIGQPIVVSSGYRSPELNKAIGGASKNGQPISQHCFGEAAIYLPGDWPTATF
ncbi:MAG: D-Ala-D-Ala carboxypeptidase family metallohydrolase [Blastocatellia bacterium]